MSEHPTWSGDVHDSAGSPNSHPDEPAWPSAGPSSAGWNWSDPSPQRGAWEVPGGYWSTERYPGGASYYGPGATGQGHGYYGPSDFGERLDGGVPAQGGGWKRRHLGARSATAVLVLVAAAVGGAVLSRAVWAIPGSTATPSAGTVPGFGGFGGFGGNSGGTGGTSQTTVPVGSGAPADIHSIASEVAPAVVDINSSFDYNDAAGAGTGIVLTRDGLVLTNNHVIAEATRLQVTDVGNGRTYGARVVGYDNTHDVALVQMLGASGLSTAKLSTATPSVGEAVVAIGNAGGAGGRPTSAGGSVTALDQSINATDALTQSSENLTGLIEVNADVQSGDSGGPLVNASGQVIGMDTAALRALDLSSAGNQGYAIPISRAMSIANQIESGRGSAVVHVGATAFLGVILAPPQQGGLGSGFGFGTTVPQPSGVPVEDVVSGGPAQRAGVTGGDYITSFDGHPVAGGTDLTHLLVPFHPGQKATLQWQTSTGQQRQATVTLASGPPS